MSRTPKRPPIKYRPDRDKWELTIHANGKRSRTLYATEDEAGKAWTANWSRHTNAGQLYRSYVARLVSREEAGRFCAIRPKEKRFLS